MIIITSLLACLTYAGTGFAADSSPQTQPQAPEAQTPEVVERVMQPWTGDFDGMAKRRLIRVLLAYGRTSYFIDRGQQRGITYELFREFDAYIK